MPRWTWPHAASPRCPLTSPRPSWGRVWPAAPVVGWPARRRPGTQWANSAFVMRPPMRRCSVTGGALAGPGAWPTSPPSPATRSRWSSCWAIPRTGPKSPTGSVHQAGNGPVLGVDQDTVRFLGSPRRSGRARSTRLAVGWVRRLARGEVVLLPPSRLPGAEVSWLTGPHMPLPDGERLLEALTRLPPPEELIVWAKQRDHAAAE